MLIQERDKPVELHSIIAHGAKDKREICGTMVKLGLGQGKQGIAMTIAKMMENFWVEQVERVADNTHDGNLQVRMYGWLSKGREGDAGRHKAGKTAEER